MRIAVFIPGFQKDESDWCIPAFTNLARELSRHAEIDVFALRHPPVRATYDVGAVRVHAIGPVAFGRLRIPIISLARVWSRTLRHFDREHRKRPFDAILSIWATESGALACLAGQRWGVPVLVHLAGGELVWLPKIRYGNWSRGLAGALVAISLANADLITIPSSYVRNLLTKKHPSAVSRATCWSL